MKTPESMVKRAFPFLVLVLFLAADLAFLTSHVYPRAGRGQSYRSGSKSSSSSYKSSTKSSTYTPSSSRSYDRRTTTPIVPYVPSRGSSPSTYAPPEFTTDYLVKSSSVVLTINRDGTAGVTEILEVDMKKSAHGIQRPMGSIYQYAKWLITNVSSPQGKVVNSASSDYGYINVGYPAKEVTGLQKFELRYTISGAVLPYARGPALAWCSYFTGTADKVNIRVQYPGAGPPLETECAIIARNGYKPFKPEPLKIVPGPGAISAATERPLQGNEFISVYVSLPETFFDMTRLNAIVDTLLYPGEKVFLQGLALKVKIHPDRTVGIQKEFAVNARQVFYRLAMTRNNEYRFFDPPFDTLKPESYKWHNTVYQYDFSKPDCASENYTDIAVCLSDSRQPGPYTFAIKYEELGNYYAGDAQFFDFYLPTVSTMRSGPIRFEIEMPSFVNTSGVMAQMFMEKGGTTLRRVSFTRAWEGNTMKGEYHGGLFDRQVLKLRLFVPPDGFSNPGVFKRAMIWGKNTWYFHPSTFITAGVIGFAGFSIFSLVLTFTRRKKGAEKKRVDKLRSAGPVTGIEDGILNKIMGEDPSFSADAFMERVRVTAEKLQAAWSDGEMKPVRNLVSQGLYNRFRLQLKMMMEEEKKLNLMGDFLVTNLMVQGINTSRNYNTLHVRLSAQARDVMVELGSSDETKRKAVEGAEVSAFTEIYSFTRRSGALTDPKKNILAGQCPSCGFVPDNFGEVNKCPSCGSIYNSGEFDWVLSEITQEEEWKESSWEDIEGLKDLEEKNVSINREVIEDRASYLFWRWIESRAAGSPIPLHRDAAKPFLDSFKPGKTFMSEMAVGAVDLRKVWMQEDRVHAQVLVLWSAAFSMAAEPKHQEHLFTLGMPVSLKNPYGLADHSCDNCGGPLPETDALTCQYCGAGLQSVNNDWLLDTIGENKS